VSRELKALVKQYLKEGATTVPILAVAGFIMSYFVWRDCCKSLNSLFWIGSFTALMWILLWLGNAFLSNVLDLYLSWQKQPLARLLAGIVGMISYTVGCVSLVVFLYDLAGFRMGNQLDNTYYSTIFFTLIITMFMTGRSFLLNWRQTAVDAEKLKRESTLAQYESLKNQVNPHFLFNSLNVLTNLVYEDQGKAVKFIKQLSEVYRYVLDSRDKEVVDLSEELMFLNSYSYLQQIRFGDKLRMDVHVNGASGKIPPLALQLLVENAIKHNEISEDHPLTISIQADRDFLIVSNTIRKKGFQQDTSSGIGLINIQKRYEFLTSTQVEIQSSQNTFTVKLPLIQA
jgi:sensor histidine kinase YesM